MDNSDFKMQVLTLLHEIPAGKVTSYGRLARLAGHPGRARQVGAILRSLPENTRLPWHRVVCASGKSAFGVKSPDAQRQLALLANEGIACDGGKVCMRRYAWP